MDAGLSALGSVRHLGLLLPWLSIRRSSRTAAPSRTPPNVLELRASLGADPTEEVATSIRVSVHPDDPAPEEEGEAGATPAPLRHRGVCGRRARTAGMLGAVSHTRPRQSSRARARSDFDDRFALTSDLARLVWAHKLWWVVPLLLALVVLGVLLVLEATPVGPLLYPVF